MVNGSAQPGALTLSVDDPRRVKAEEYHKHICGAVWATFVEQFQDITKQPGVDFGLLNKAAIGAFLDCAVRIAVDDGMHEDQLAQIIRIAHRAAYAAAPKFG